MGGYGGLGLGCSTNGGGGSLVVLVDGGSLIFLRKSGIDAADIGRVWREVSP